MRPGWAVHEPPLPIARWQEMLGLANGNSLTSPANWLDRIHPQDRERLTCAMDAHLQGTTPTLEIEYRILHQDGGYRWMIDENAKAAAASPNDSAQRR